jgi:hypothetical protein
MYLFSKMPNLCSGAHTASYLVNTGGKMAGAWNWSLPCIAKDKNG